MKNNFVRALNFTPVFTIVFLSTLPASAAAPLTLESAFQASLLRSEDVATQEENLVQAEEKIRQAWGSLIPNISGTFTQLYQATPSSSSGASFFPGSQTTAKLTATQPLFQGFREFNGLKQLKKGREAAEYSREYAKQLLFQDVTTAFYQVLQLEADVKNLKTEIKLYTARLNEVSHFRKIGRAREVDLLTLKSNIATLEASIISSEAAVKNSREVLAFLTGLEQGVELDDNENIPTETPLLDSYLAKIETRPDVLSKIYSLQSADSAVDVTKGAHLPTINLAANYYFERPGVLHDVNWDVQVAVSLPIFAGGVIQSQVRTNASLTRQAELALSKAKRTAKQQIESSFYLYTGDVAQHEKLKTALSLSASTYALEQEYYRRGQVTQVEVLQSLTTFQENQRALDRVYFQMKADFIKLQAAAGFRPALKVERTNS